MKAGFTVAILYEVEACCRTPLRSAGADGDMETVLRAPDGRCFLQGSSLAGALREWLTQHGKETEGLFGSQNSRGRLMVSDGLFTGDANTALRPRLRIDGRTGAAAEKAKFDLAHVEVNSRFAFSLTWLGFPEQEETDIPLLEALLSALHAGQIRLGAQKSNGFGRVELSVKKQRYDLCRPEDRDAWLEDRRELRPLELQPKSPEAENRVRFSLNGTADNLLVKFSAPEQREKRSVTVFLREAGVPVLPGSSVKGAVRAQAEKIAAFAGLNPDIAEKLFGRGAAGDDDGLPGRAVFQDCMLSRGREREISRIRINRFTGGVMDRTGGLFTEAPLCSELCLNVSVPDGSPAACMLLLYALRDLGLGLYNLGSGGSLGRGFLNAEELRAQLPGGSTLTLRFQEDGSCAVSDPDGILDEWQKAWEEEKQ